MARPIVPGLVLAALLPAAPIAAAEETPTYDRVSLSVSANDQVANDILIARLYAEQEGEDIASITGEVNERVEWALEEARGAEGVTAQTLSYQTTPIRRNQNLVGWRVSQGVRLRSADADTLSDLLGRLQSRMALRGLDYAISPERLQQAEARLIDTALDAFVKRAAQVAARLGRPGYRLVQVDIGTSDRDVRPRFARNMVMESSTADSPPALEAGTQEVVVTASGTIELEVRQR